MRSIVRLGTPAVLLAALLACSSGSTPAAPRPAPTPEALVGTPLATVNGAKVGSVGWEALVDRKQPADPEAWSAEEKKQFLDEAIDEELLFQEAFARAVYQDPKVRRILVNLLLRSEIYEKVNNETFTDEQMREHYEAHKDEYIIPEKVQIKRIFVAVEGQQRAPEQAKALIDQAYARVSADATAFRDVATELSEDPFARRGGDVGFVERSGRAGLSQAIVDRAFGMEEGQITPPFEEAGGWNILYVPSRRERVERPFDTMKGSILRRMKNERYETMAEAFAQQLRAKAQVSVDEAALSGWTPAVPAKPGAMLRPDGMAPPGTFAERPADFDGPSEEEMNEAAGAPPAEGAGEN